MAKGVDGLDPAFQIPQIPIDGWTGTGIVLALRHTPCFGGVLVSTDSLKPGLHAEVDRLAS